MLWVSVSGVHCLEEDGRAVLGDDQAVELPFGFDGKTDGVALDHGAFGSDRDELVLMVRAGQRAGDLAYGDGSSSEVGADLGPPGRLLVKASGEGGFHQGTSIVVTRQGVSALLRARASCKVSAGSAVVRMPS